ncbi:MAG: serpin family protein [Candidatus Binataceae bacterium]
MRSNPFARLRKHEALKTKSSIAVVALFLAILGFGAAARAETPQAPDDASSAATAINDFGFRLLRNVVKAGENENVIVSPLSVSLALAMAYNGAVGDTKTAIAKTLAIPSGVDINRANRELQRDILKADPAVKMEIANALWPQSGFTINPEFLKLSRESYDAPVESLDFIKGPQQAADIINAWVDKNTHDKIKQIIKRPDPATVLMITDAVYFKGRWSIPFDAKATEPRDFHLQGGGTVKAPMMSQHGEYPYSENDRFQVIRLSYGNKRFAMYVFLPRKNAGLSDFLASLDQPHWKQWTSQFLNRKGLIVLPKLESSWGESLNNALKAMGMAVAFNPLSADFSRIHPVPPRLLISDVEHKTYVKIDEEGTEAAAATSIGVVAMAMMKPPPPFEMIVDHPYFCAIVEQQSGAVMFAGVVNDPTRRGR